MQGILKQIWKWMSEDECSLLTTQGWLLLRKGHKLESQWQMVTESVACVQKDLLGNDWILNLQPYKHD